MVEHTEEEWLGILGKDGMQLAHVPMNQLTWRLCMAAVRQNGMALEYVPHPREEIVFIAIRNAPRAIRFAEIQTPEMCRLAVSLDGMALKELRWQNREICRIACGHDPEAIRFVRPENMPKESVQVQPDKDQDCNSQTVDAEVVEPNVGRTIMTVAKMERYVWVD